MTTSVHYVQAVRMESRSKRQFGSNQLTFTQFMTVQVNSRQRVNAHLVFVNDKEGKIQTDTTKIIEVWKEHYAELLNVTNPRKDLEECGPITNITLEEVGTQLQEMKTGNAYGPDQIPIEVWKLLGDEGVDYLLHTMNAVLVEGMPQP